MPFEQAQQEVAEAIGVDYSNTYAAEERHFDPATLLYLFATQVIVAFLKGFIEEAIKRGVGKIIEIFGDEIGKERVGDVRVFQRPLPGVERQHHRAHAMAAGQHLTAEALIRR